MKKLFTCLLLFYTLQYTTAQSIEITDPCDCTSGIDLDGDGINDLALVTITITDPGGVWGLVSNDNLVDANGMTATVITAPVMDNGDGTFTFQAYLPADGTTTYTAYFLNPVDNVLEISGGPCNVCPASNADIPTVGEWGLIILGLLMFITAVVGIRQRREEEAYN